jgi:hypothetical protein
MPGKSKHSALSRKKSSSKRNSFGSLGAKSVRTNGQQKRKRVVSGQGRSMKNVTRQNKIKLNIKMMLESLLKQTDNHYMLFKRSKVVIVHDRKVGKMSWCKRIEKKRTCYNCTV